MVDQGESGREFPVWMKILSVATPLLVAVVGYHQSREINQVKVSLSEKIEETRRIHEFSERILEYSDDLTKTQGSQAKVALLGLYRMAALPLDKLIILQIAEHADEPELRKVAIRLIPGFVEEHKTLLSEHELAILDEISEAIASKDGEDLVTSANEIAGKPASPALVQVADTAEARAVRAVTQQAVKKEQLSGCFYVGKSQDGDLLAEDKTIERRNISNLTAGDRLKTTTNVALREECTTTKGKVKGILPKGQRVVVDGSSSVELQQGVRGYWVRIRTI